MPKNTLIPMDRLLEIAHQSVRKHRDESHPDYEDFVQDVLLGVLERQDEYDPARGTSERFVISVARQKARNRVVERRREQEQMTTNHRSRIPFRTKLRNVEEADEHGRLPFHDDELRLAQLTSLLAPEQATLLTMLRAGHPVGSIRKKLGVSPKRFEQIGNELKNFFQNHAQKNFEENIFSFR